MPFAPRLRDPREPRWYEDRTGTRRDRVVWFLLFAIPAVVLYLATTITPDPAGHGTHQQLGLPPCGFLVVTGIPCPGCGLTTAFAHLVRFEVLGAAKANPFGILVFLVTVCTAFVSLVGLVRGLALFRTLDRLAFEFWAILLAASGIVVWGVRVATLTFGL